jgi:hypothetical protein
MSSGLGAVAGVVQAGAGLFGGGSTTQYVPNYSSMNETIRGSVQQQELNYQAQSQLLNNSFMTQMGLQDAEYKQLLQQLEYDRANGQLDLQNQILQNEQALNMAEMNLAMQHLSDTYSLEAQRASANMEYTNAIQSFDNAAWLRSEASQVRESQFQADLAEGQAQIGDLRTSYERTQDQQRLQREQLGLQYQDNANQYAELGRAEQEQNLRLTSDLASISSSRQNVQSATDKALADAQLQRQSIMMDFLNSQTKDVRDLALKTMAMNSQGLVDTSVMQAQNAVGSEEDWRERQLQKQALGNQIGQAQSDFNTQNAQLNTQEGLARSQNDLSMLGIQNQRGALGTARQGLDIQERGLGLNEANAAQQYGTQNRQLNTQLGSLINSNYGNVLSQEIAPSLDALLQRRQTEQQNAVNGVLQDVAGLVQGYNYEQGLAGVDFARTSDRQSAQDYSQMIDSQAAANNQAALAAYLTGQSSAYGQLAGSQSQLASGTSAGMNQLASQMQSTPMVTGGGGGTNWQGLGSAAANVYGLLSGGGGGSTAGFSTNSGVSLPTYNYANTQSAFVPNTGYSGFLSGNLFGG